MIESSRDAELGCTVHVPPEMLRRGPAALLIGQARKMMDSALRSKGVRLVHQHEPRYMEAFRSDINGEMIGPYWIYQASGISLCIRDGHTPYVDEPGMPSRSFMCERCKAIIDHEAYEAFAGVSA